MKATGYSLFLLLGLSISGSLLNAQQQAGSSPVLATVPRLVNFSGRATDAQGKTVSGISGITFAIYKDQYDGVPLWMETQNVQADAKGNYTAQLGASTSEGLPLALFSSGEARWLGLSVNGESEQPRILLLSVPYALKAADAQTLGGLPASAFMMAPPTNGSKATSASSSTSSSSSPGSPNSAKKPPQTPVSGSGTQNFIPLWTDNNGTLGNSVFFQVGSGATAKVGLNLKTPLATLDVNGITLIRGTLEPVTKGVATASKGFTSNPLDLEASSFSSTTQKAVMQHFEWQAEPTGNNTNNTGATLNLLFGQNNNIPAETGLTISSTGAFTAGEINGTSIGTVTAGVTGENSVTGYGVLGVSIGSSGRGVYGVASNGQGVRGESNGSGPVSDGVHGETASAGGSGVAGVNNAGGIGVYGVGGTGVYGQTGSYLGSGVSGFNSDPNNYGDGVYGSGSGNGGHFVGTPATNQYFSGTGVYAIGADEPAGNHVPGDGVDGYGGSGNDRDGAPGGSFAGGPYGLQNAGDGVIGWAGDWFGANTGYGGEFYSNVWVHGNLTKSGGSFKIDHPLDPANKYLYHSFVESPDMMNVYNGNVILDGIGEAIIQLPEWFETLNRDFRYQLTAIGAPGPNLFVAAEVSGNRFKVAGGRPGGKVSWQVTGIRHDEWANAHRIPLEEAKPERERGFYLHPELYGAPEEEGIAWARYPEMLKRMKGRRGAHLAREVRP